MKFLKRQILRIVDYVKHQTTTQHWFRLYLEVYNMILSHLFNIIMIFLNNANMCVLVGGGGRRG
jgi:hypothetical protein